MEIFRGLFLFSFVQNGLNYQGGYWREKVSDLFGQTAHFPPVGSERKSSRKSGPPYRFLSRGGTERRKCQNLSFKTGKTLQWVLERENFRKPSVLPLCRGYQLRDRNFLQKSLVKTASHNRWEVRRDFFSQKRTTRTVFLQWVLEGIASGDPSDGPDGTGLFGKW